MNQQLHTDLNEAFSQHLSRLPQDAVERLRQVDYRPRTGRVSPRVTVGAVSGVAATTAAVVSAVVLTSAAPAFGGWTARPTASAAKPTASANASCQAQLSSLPGAPAGPWTAVVTDVRGPFTLTVYRDDGTYGTCLTGRSLTAVNETSNGSASTSVQSSAAGIGHAGTSRGSIIYPGGSGGVQELSVQSLSATGHGSYTVADGNVASDVSALTFVLSNGKQVQTTLGDGWFVAWWPGDADAVSVQVTTPTGTTSLPLKVLQPPAPLGTSGSSGSGASGTSGSGASSPSGTRGSANVGSDRASS